MTDKFRQECKNYANANRLGKIEYGDNKVISGSDFLQSLTVEDSCIVNGNINGAISSKTNKFTTLDNFEITNNEYDVKIGVKYADNSTEYIKMGKYLLQDQTNEKTAKTGEFQGLDILNNLNEKYVCNITDFTNKTIKDMLIDALTQSNIELGTETFTNENIPITGNPFTNNETRRDVVNAILKVTLNFASIDCDDNKLYLKWLDTEVSETITKDDYSSLEKNNVYGPINCLVLRMSGVEGENVTRQDNASISSNGENQFIIEDDYFLITEELRTTYIDNLWNKIKGFTYVDCKITSSTGKPYLRAGNKISVQDDDESYFDTYVLKHTFTYDGTFQSVIESPALTKEEEKTKNIQTLKDFKKLTQIKVDKANQRIDAVVQTQEDLSDTLIPLAISNGVELKLEKSAGQPLVEFELEGNSEQDSYEGTNLLNPNGSTATNKGVTLTNNEDGTFTVSGTSTEALSIPITKDIIEMTAGETYTNSVEVLSGSLSNGTITVTVENDNQERTYNYMNVGGSVPVRSKTIEENLKIVGYAFYTTTNQTVNCTFRPQFNKGSQKLPYEPYVGGTQSPNPDYPQTISVIGGDLSLKGVGENLYEKVNHKSTNTTVSDKDITFDFSVDQDTFARLQFRKEIGKTYTIVFDGSGLKDGESVEFYLESTTQNRNVFKNGKNIWVQKALDEKQSFTIDDWYRTNITSAITLSNIMILEGAYDESNVPEYMPYQETITEIDLQGNFIAKLPNGIKDRLYLSQGHLYLEKNINRTFVNIKSTTVYNGKVIGIFGVSGKRTTNTSDNGLLYSHAVVERSFKENTCYENPANVCFVGNSTDTLETLKAKYDDGTLYFVLATPVIHDLGEYSIETLKGNSTIRAISNLQPSNMYCKYIRDIEGLDVFQTKNDMADYYNKFETDSRISIETDSIVEQVGSIASLVDANGKAIETVNNRVTEQITSTQAQIEVVENKVNNGVETLKNSLVTININGIQVSTNLSKISTVMTNDTFAVQDSSGTYLARFGYDEETESSIAEMDNLTVGNYFVAGVHRQEKFQDEETNEWRTGFFYIGGSE